MQSNVLSNIKEERKKMAVNGSGTGTFTYVAVSIPMLPWLNPPSRP